MLTEIESAEAAAPQKQSNVQQSPWKKPKVSLLRSKSLKRKSDIFNLSSNTANNSSINDNSQNELDESSRSSKLFKSSNRFSISTNISTNFNDSASATSDKNELYNFFAGSSNNVLTEINKDEKYNKSLEKSAILNEKLIAGIISSVVDTKKEVQPVQPTYLFEHTDLLPTDWSLKTRLRFLSTVPFSCYSGIKSQHESEAILNYSKFNMFYKNLEACKFNSTELNKDSYKTLLCESISYWTFPYLPWLNLYPRNLGLSSITSEPLNLEIQKTLSKSWNQSFKSLYNSLKSNQCPYFYILTQSFMVLFRSQNIGGIDEMHAILTPSTKGLRQALKDINFTMPLATATQNSKNKSELDNTNESINNQNNSTSEPLSNSMNDQASGDVSNTKNQSNSNISVTNEDNDSNDSEKDLKKEKKKSSDDDDDDEDEDNEDEDSEEPDEWLEEIGLNSAVNFKASVLQRNSKSAQKDSLFNFDNRPKSTLLFSQGGDVQALFNFLLNSKTCIASSGPLSGIPPTLLSPLPFVSASLQKIKVEQNVVKSLTKSGDPLTQYALDFIGPLMPYHIHRLCNLFRLTQNDQFEMVANTYEQSAALNCAKKQEVTQVNSDSDDENDSTDVCKYLDSSELNSMQNNFGIFGESNSIKSICVKDNYFCCN